MSVTFTGESVYATGANLGIAGEGTFSWDPDVYGAWVVNDWGSESDLYVKWNGSTAASPTNKDARLRPGDSVKAPENMVVRHVRIYSTAAVTYKTDFDVYGWAQ